MKSFGYAWAGALLGCCALSTQAFAQHAAVTVLDTAGQPVTDAAIYYDASGAPLEKVDYNGSTVFLNDLGQKVDIRVEHQSFGTHTVGVELKAEGKFYVDIVLTGDDILTKVRPATVDLSTGGAAFREQSGTVAVGVNGSDSCGSAAAIGGSGAFAFDSTGAATDGVAGTGADCNEGFGNDDVNNDIWYAWTADCDGTASVDTCGSSFDTRLGAYNNAACPPGNADLLDCNDDFCGLQSGISFAATSGTTYLIRVGSFSDTPGTGGAGTLNITCDGGGGGGCGAAGFCQDPDQINATDSNTDGGLGLFTAAENFSATADGDITDICWWGVGFEASCTSITDFTVTYYNDDANGVCPGTVKAGPFNVTASPSTTGLLVAGLAPEVQWSASHAPVSVTAGECCWIEIRNNDGSCRFFWETSPAGDGRSCSTENATGVGSDSGLGDLAFCTNLDFDNTNCDITGPGNDLCENAEAIAGQGTFGYDNTGAGTDGPAHVVCDFFTDGGNTDNDIWYCWTADCTGDVRFETCGLTGTDSKINVYDGCGTASDANLIECNDDDCGFQSGLTFAAVSGNTYKLRVGNFPGADAGAGAFSLTCVSLPGNDECADAIAVSVPSTTSGTTVFAGIDDAPNCGDEVTAPGVWYSVTGTGNTMTANTCQNPNYDTKLSVYCGSCDQTSALTCVGSNDDACSFQSEVSWCSQNGSEYLILVHGFGGASGTFDLAVFDDGTSCSGAVQCQTAGACCTGADLETCVVVTADECAALGGDYQGDDTNCGGYSASTCVNAFQDISGSGTDLGLGDDAGTVVPLGFAFDFFGNTENSIAVCSNGYLTFGTTLGAFTETSIPDPTDPSALIAPMWDDFSPNQGGAVLHETTGPVGNRVFIAQWNDVPQFNTGDANTFQALLFEADNSIEFRYGTVNVDGIADGTVGIENADGTAGTQWTDGVAGGDCVRFDLDLACPPPECHLVFAQTVGNDTFNQGGHTWNTQLEGVISTYAVWLDDTPQFQIPPFNNFPNRWNGIMRNLRSMMIEDVPYQTYSVQVVMWNPEVFPANPEQYTDVLNVTVWLSGRVTTTSAGSADNMNLWYEVVDTVEGYKYIRFPFSINGF